MIKSKQPVIKANKKPSGTKKNHKAISVIPKGYSAFLEDLKNRIRSAQVKAAVRVNEELIKLYWSIGKDIAECQERGGWGTQVIERLAKDLQSSFPGVEGFSRSNVFRMKAFFSSYQKVAQVVRQIDELPIFRIPWGHNIILMQKLKDDDQRLWYANQAIEHGWSRGMLTIWIENDLYRREGKAITNFKKALPASQSDLAQQSLKDPYVFDFLTLHKEHLENDLEDGLVNHIQKFLIELGHGFAFVGRQYPIKAGEKNLYVDLLFYHLKLRCYIIVELKAKEFDSRDAGQMSAYLSAVDDLLRHEDDKPSIGMILCKTKDNVFVEYVLRNFNRPIGVAQFEVNLFEKLPTDLKSSLPTIEEIEAELEERP